MPTSIRYNMSITVRIVNMQNQMNGVLDTGRRFAIVATVSALGRMANDTTARRRHVSAQRARILHSYLHADLRCVASSAAETDVMVTSHYDDVDAAGWRRR